MPKTSSHYIITLANLAKRLGMDDDMLLARWGIYRKHLKDKNLWIDSHVLAALVKTLWLESNDETMGIDPNPSKMGSWALACDYMLVAETLGELYRRGEHIYSYLPPDTMGMSFSIHGNKAIVEMRSYVGERDPNHLLTEFLGVAWHRFPCWAVDEYVPLNQAFFSYPAPSHWRLYEELFQCPVLFEQSFSGFSFVKKYLGKPICRNRKELAAWLRNSPADLLYMPGRDSSIAHHLKKQLTGGLREKMQFPAFNSICESLRMSNQVVRRRLEEEGTSYQKIKNSVRIELIKELLVNPDLSIADITERSGFTEASSLTRAFKKWTGLTPVQYRDKKTSNR